MVQTNRAQCDEGRQENQSGINFIQKKGRYGRQECKMYDMNSRMVKQNRMNGRQEVKNVIIV